MEEKTPSDQARDTPLVKGDSGQIHQVFTNLLLNAVQAVNSNDPGKGKPEPESREETLSSQPVL